MNKRLVALLLLLLLTFGAAPSASAQEAESTPDNGRPYYIMVNRLTNTVTVYGVDESGYYRAPVRVMVCSTGRPGHRTPLGTYSVTGVKKEWCLMVDGSYGQFSTQFNGKILFHSVCYRRRDPAALMTEEYNALGNQASLGCVRLQVADAKWIYENCAAGTKVTVYESEDPGPLGKPLPLVRAISPELDNGWDPTDPREENPWKPLLEQALTLPEVLRLTTGEQFDLSRGLPFSFDWASSSASAAAVDRQGLVTAMGPGTAVIAATRGDRTVQCTVTVTGAPLPYRDVLPGSWYYGAVRFSWERGLLQPAEPEVFGPSKPAARREAQAALRILTDDPTLPASSREQEGTPLTRQELALLLYRTVPPFTGDVDAVLSGFEDLQEAAPQAREALAWAVQARILQGDGGRLFPASPLNRAQLAVILNRFAALPAAQES